MSQIREVDLAVSWTRKSNLGGEPRLRSTLGGEPGVSEHTPSEQQSKRAAILLA